jgi:hypothetical protein
MRYDTNNLDEAAYLALQGYRFTVARTGRISALFSFEKDAELDEVLATFWKGEANVHLHSWLATRVALKNECAGQALSLKRVSSPPLAPAGRNTAASVRRGQAYWYNEGDTTKSEKFGNKPLHKLRMADNNFYLTREDAKLRRNAVRVE